MRGLVLLVVALVTTACSDLRDFRGPWAGPRVGDSPALRVGALDTGAARLDVLEIDRHGLEGRLVAPGLASEAIVTSVPGAEADVLAGVTFAGDPLRVYLAFAPTTDGGGDAMAVISLHEDDRVELRLLRGGPAPLYAVFALRRDEVAP
jgi:hypothetical protein